MSNLSPDNLRYTWQDNWGGFAPAESFAHHGIAVMADGRVLTGLADEPTCVVLTSEGETVRRFPVPVANTHSLESTVEGGKEVIWITDNVDCQVVKVDSEGALLARLTRDDFPIPGDVRFCPTGTSVNPVTGEIWIADGYGSSTVHCFSSQLEHRLTLTGEYGLGHFRQPHSVFVDTRRETPRIYVADRANDRVQVFDSDGTYLSGIAENLRKPSIFATFERYLVIGELAARVVVCDEEDKIIQTLGSGEAHLEKEGWPNRIGPGGEKVSPLDDIPTGEFNSPHGVCADGDGNIYVSEWLIGDRFTKLVRES